MNVMLCARCINDVIRQFHDNHTISKVSSAIGRDNCHFISRTIIGVSSVRTRQPHSRVQSPDKFCNFIARAHHTGHRDHSMKCNPCFRLHPAGQALTTRDSSRVETGQIGWRVH